MQYVNPFYLIVDLFYAAINDMNNYFKTQLHYI